MDIYSENFLWIKNVQKFAKFISFDYNYSSLFYVHYLMLGNTRLSKQLWNVIKVFGVAVAVYLALTLKIWLTWESDEVNQFDYLQIGKKSDEWLPELDELDIHWVSTDFSKICSKYWSICNKISWAGSFADDEKVKKLVYVTYLLKILDVTITRWENPSKALLAMLINKQTGARRGSANRNTVTVNLWWMKYDNEFFQVISHEMWHIVDLWWLQWVSKRKSQNYTEFNKAVFSLDDPSLEYYKYSRSSEKVRKGGMTKEDFCSWYGMSDPFEDFAECHNLYLNHHDYFRKLAMNNLTVKNKYNFLSNLYGWKYINNSEAKYQDRENSYRVWDTTKILEG